MAFNQGTNLLGLRKARKKEVLGKHRILEGFDNASGSPQSYSSCGAEAGKPRYGWCPPTPNDLWYEKDDGPVARQAQVDKLYGLMSQYGTLYKNYIENVQNYVNNPPGWIYGQNVYVPPCWGDDDCGAAPCPSCPKGNDPNSVKNQCTNCDPATIAKNLGTQYQFDPTVCPTRNSLAQCTAAGGTWGGSGTSTPAPPPTCKNMDGRYDFGDPKRYTGGYALASASSASQCDDICSSQSECKVSGQTCKSTWYSDGDRCYCSFCVPNTPPAPPPPPPSACWFQITGQCAGYPDMNNKSWFKDSEYGGSEGVQGNTQATCDARKKSWQQSCGANAVISEWYGSGDPPATADKPDYSACGCAAIVQPNGVITGQSSLLDRGFPAANLTAGNRYCWTSDWGTPAEGIAACEKSNGCMVVGDPSKSWQGGCVTKGPPR